MIAPFYKKILFILFLVAPLTVTVSAQSIDKPTFQFTQICANSSYNTYSVSFTHSGNFDPSNQFILELSDASGSFAGGTTVYTSAVGAIVTSPGTITFSVPPTTAGDMYRLRVKSTAPAATGQPSTGNFVAYYKPQDSQFSINNFVSTANYCSGGNFILKIDNPGTGTNDSPLKYPSLKYNWFRENNGGASAPTLLAAASGGSYTVTQPGIYYVETNYGACTSYSYSNRVTVSEATGNASSSITSSLGNPFCPGSGATILSTAAGVSYQWSKDGVALSGATNQTYSANVGGLYSVKVNFGGCTADGSINLQTQDFTASLNVAAKNPIDIQAGETLAVAVTTTATAAVYKWFLNGTVIPDALSDNHLVNGLGNYKVEVTQTTSCTITKELVFTVTDSNEKFEKIPNIIRLNSSYNVWQIPEKYRNDSTEVMIVSSSGEIFKTNNYQNDWPKETPNFSNINPVYYYIISSGSEVKKGSITVIK
jgi:hypothetical protein